MNFLLVNDDGINSPGLHALAKAASEKGRVFVCAPDRQQSAKSHAITLGKEVAVKEERVPFVDKAWSAGGTPADCTRLGFQLCREEGVEIDMVLSGINMGANLGKDTIYSGTVGAAMEAAMTGIHAMAVSVDSHEASHFGGACAIAMSAVDRVMKELPAAIVLSINTPDIPEEELKGVRVTGLGPRFYEDRFVKTADGYYKVEGEPIDPSAYDPMTVDVGAVNEGYAAVTPLSFDLTAAAGFDMIKDWSFRI